MVHVAALPPKPLDPDLLRKAASLLGKEIVDARLLLAGELPRIIVSYPEAGAADSMARSLREAGLAAFICTDAELRNRPAGFRAHVVEAGERGVVFRDRLGAEVGIEAGEAFLIIRGRVKSITQEKALSAKIKLNVPATVLAGGIPILRRATEKNAPESFQAEDFVKIYDSRSSDPRVEIVQNRVDYGFLGPDLAPSAAVNFDALVKKLREWFPTAIFDERLTGHVKSGVPGAGAAEALEVRCKLIYLSHRAVRYREDSPCG